MNDTWGDIENFYNEQIERIANRCREILEDSIQSEVYDKYTPLVYNRTYQLLDNIRTDIKDGSIYVYVNTGNMHYDSNNKEGIDYTNWVPYWVNYGHNRDILGGKFMYDYYPSRNYIQVAKERIEQELGLSVEIIENEI